MIASDVMTRKIISIDPDSTVLQAARLMLQHRISGLPVLDKNGKLVGVLSEGDFLRRRETKTERHRSRWLEFLMGPGTMATEYTHSHGNRVAEVMTTDVQSVEDSTPLEDIVDLMEKHRIKRVPVLCGGELVGIITRSNLMHAMVSMAPVALTNAVVHDGVVELWGVLTDERQREALKVLAANIPGVKAVKDHMVWVEPMSGLAIEAQESPRN